MKEQIESIITGGRKAIYSDTVFEADISYGLAPIKTDSKKDNFPPYSHYVIQGKGESKKEALKAFWEDYNSQGPFSENEIFWRLKPCHERDAAFDADKILHVINARFSIRD